MYRMTMTPGSAYTNSGDSPTPCAAMLAARSRSRKTWWTGISAPQRATKRCLPSSTTNAVLDSPPCSGSSDTLLRQHGSAAILASRPTVIVRRESRGSAHDITATFERQPGRSLATTSPWRNRARRPTSPFVDWFRRVGHDTGMDVREAAGANFLRCNVDLPCPRSTSRTAGLARKALRTRSHRPPQRLHLYQETKLCDSYR